MIVRRLRHADTGTAPPISGAYTTALSVQPEARTAVSTDNISLLRKLPGQTPKICRMLLHVYEWSWPRNASVG
jgi:hypothetical protein